MPHIHSENIHHSSRRRRIIPAVVSVILFVVCALAFSVTNKSKNTDPLHQHDNPSNAQEVEITISGYVKNQFGTGVGGAVATLTGSFSQTTTTDESGHYSFSVPAGIPPNCYKEYFVEAMVGERIIAQISSSGCLTYNFTYDDIICDPPAPCPTPTPTPTPTPEPLIFIPGSAGSQLKVAGGDTVWPSRSADPKRLTLDPEEPQENIIAPDVFRQFRILFFNTVLYQKDVYNKLLEMLSSNGYREYEVNHDPVRRTVAGCDLSQQANNPTLFVFAYDWRQSNVDNARHLKDYVGTKFPTLRQT